MKAQKQLTYRLIIRSRTENQARSVPVMHRSARGEIDGGAVLAAYRRYARRPRLTYRQLRNILYFMRKEAWPRRCRHDEHFRIDSM